MAAVLACEGAMADGKGSKRGINHGDGSVAVSCRNVALSHGSAAALWGLLPPRPGSVEVTVAGDGGRERRKGIRLHRSKTLMPAMITRRRGIPVTTSARTIADLRRAVSAGPRQGTITPNDLRRAIRQAGVLGLSVGMEAVPDRTRSELERLFLRLCRRHRIPTPEINAQIASFEVDFLWRNRKLIVETDGYTYHRGRAAFEDDRDRDLRLRALGHEVVRLTYRQIVQDPKRIAELLKRELD